MSKQNSNDKHESVEGTEIAKEIVVETAKDAEAFFKKVGDVFNNIGAIFVNPTKLSSMLKLNRLDSVYELFLRDERLLKLLALFAAIIIAATVRYAPNMQERYSVDINGYELVSYYDTERMVIEGLPDTVDVTLVGEKNQVNITKTKETFEIMADLTDLPPGTHKVNLDYSKISEQVDVKINPSTIVVTIMELTENDEKLNHEFVNLDKIDEMYVLQQPKLAVDSVKVKGPQEIVDEVATVKAIIDVTDLTKLSDYEAPIYAYDKNGDKLEVEIKPDKVHTSVEVTSPSKVIPIEAIVTGNPPDGYSINTITLTPSEVKVYGDKESLDAIQTMPVQVDLYQLDDNQELIVKLDKPESLHKMDVETTKVNVSFDKTKTKKLDDVAIDYQNLDSKLKIKALSIEEATVDVTLKGSQALLSTVNPDELDIYIDLTGYGVGEHEVPIILNPPTGLVAEMNKTKVTVIITE